MRAKPAAPMSAAGAIGGSLQWSECNGSAAQTVAGQKNNGGRIPRGTEQRHFARIKGRGRDDHRRRGHRRRCGGQRSIFWQFHHNGVRKKRRGKDPITGKQFSAGVQHDRLELVRFFGNGLRKDPATVFRNQDIVLDADTDSAIDIWRLLRLGAEIEPGLDG